MPVDSQSRHEREFSTPEQSLYGLLRSQAELRPDAAAVLGLDAAPLTYQGLLRQVESLGRTLNAHGLGLGDRVALVLPNGPDLAVAFLAVACSASCAPLNP